MGIEQYVGVGKPDDEKKEKAPLGVITAAFQEWVSAMEAIIKPTIWTDAEEKRLDKLKCKAKTILARYGEELPDVIDDTYFIPIHILLKQEQIHYAGLFYTAMLETGSGKTLVIPAGIGGWDERLWGYKLKRGTIINKSIDCSVGMQADSGLFINENETGFISMGDCARGGIFVNNGYSLGYGVNAVDGIFLNFGRVSNVAPRGKAILLNYGKVSNSVLRFPKAFPDERRPWESFQVSCRGFRPGPFILYREMLIKGKTLEKNQKLEQIMNSVAEAAEKKDWRNVKRMAHEIREYCIVHYKASIV